MKKLSLIGIIGFFYYCSLYSMHCMLRQSVKISNNKNRRLYSIAHMREIKKILHNKNFLVSAANIAAYGITQNPITLIPVLPQIVHASVMNFYDYQQRNQSQVQKDLYFFIKNNPSIIDDLTKMREIAEKITLLRNEYETTKSISKQYIDEDKTLYAQHFHTTIHYLEKQKIKLEDSTVARISHIFDRYHMVDIQQSLKESEKYHKHLSILYTLSQCSALSSFPFAMVPDAWRDVIRSSTFSETFVNSFYAGFLTAVYLFFVSTVDYPALPAAYIVLPIYYASLGLSNKTAYDNIKVSFELISKIHQQKIDHAYVIELFKVQEAYSEQVKKYL